MLPMDSFKWNHIALPVLPALSLSMALIQVSLYSVSTPRGVTCPLLVLLFSAATEYSSNKEPGEGKRS